MPVTHERDDARRLITVKVTDPYDRADILQVINRQASDDSWDYALLYDLRATKNDPAEADLHEFAARVRAFAGGRPRGPVAVVIGPRPKLFQIGRTYAEMIKDFAELELLFTDAQVADWLQRNARRGRRGTRER